MRRILLAFILAVAVSGLATAAVNDIKVSGDIAVNAVSRDLSLGNQELDTGIHNVRNRDRDNFITSQVRLRFDADLTENVSAVVQLINERLWGAEDEWDVNDVTTIYGDVILGSVDNDIDLDLAYFTMKEMLYEPLTLTIGRQLLRFGSGLIIGDPNATYVFADSTAGPGGSMFNGLMIAPGGDAYTAGGGLMYLADDLSLRKAFDAVRATLDYSPLVIDLVYSKISEDLISSQDDVDLMGANLAYQLDDTTLLEGYFWSKRQDDSPYYEYIIRNTSTLGIALDPLGALDDNDNVYTIGLRAETAVTDQLSLFGEYAYQFGDIINTVNMDPVLIALGADAHCDRDAFAVQLGGAYKFNDEGNSHVSLVYTYLSGDDDIENDKWEMWDPMFEDQNGGEIANLFINSGVQSVKLSGSTMPREDMTAILDFYWYRFTENMITDMWSVNQPLFRPSTARIYYFRGPLADNHYWVNRDEKDLGWELDAKLLYDYTEDVQMGLVSAWFFPGDFFNEQNDETAYSLRAFAKVDF
ncbi:MAG: alginate export family protein [Candidatus Omnitrophica bacterium]|nr:alginate export family protein [Candidatus Omnitrophota bacterium]